METKKTTDIKLTQYSHGAGCGCKISPALLDEILKTGGALGNFSTLLIGNDKRDDAAVMDIGNGKAIVSTTDFFMPIVDDPFDFGRIAAANAISDIYAMGAKPLLAIAILGWPVEKIPPSIAGEVVHGANTICKKAGIPLAGGHSIDSPEPIFGLAVTGIVDIVNIKSNSSAKAGDFLYLTKPIGIGIFTTAAKKGLISEKDIKLVTAVMTTLNSIGEKFGALPSVTAMTDVTGFGLLGHLAEMAEGSGLSAEINMADVPLLAGVDKYLEQKCIPGGTKRNEKSYGHKISPIDEYTRNLLCDPQTSGGLLVAVNPKGERDFLQIISAAGIQSICAKPIGRMADKKDLVIIVTPQSSTHQTPI